MTIVIILFKNSFRATSVTIFNPDKFGCFFKGPIVAQFLMIDNHIEITAWSDVLAVLRDSQY